MHSPVTSIPPSPDGDADADDEGGGQQESAHHPRDYVGVEPAAHTRRPANLHLLDRLCRNGPWKEGVGV